CPRRCIRGARGASPPARRAAFRNLADAWAGDAYHVNRERGAARLTVYASRFAKEGAEEDFHVQRGGLVASVEPVGAVDLDDVRRARGERVEDGDDARLQPPVARGVGGGGVVADEDAAAGEHGRHPGRRGGEAAEPGQAVRGRGAQA